jgi:hypothetical protein
VCNVMDVFEHIAYLTVYVKTLSFRNGSFKRSTYEILTGGF